MEICSKCGKDKADCYCIPEEVQEQDDTNE